MISFTSRTKVMLFFSKKSLFKESEKTTLLSNQAPKNLRGPIGLKIILRTAMRKTRINTLDAYGI